ncbi:carbohydrate kinase family protein [Desulfovibrio sp. 86]|uniref:PfkB domain protein n=1 Tax=uncultured Desulfovibrio sp. TaxID=167968 RepID=A0A212L4J1_9BACT|nr:carbohydrate kinase family protein [Desulfovibrio sp. 86]SCM72494.1 PfkB domain protein [uncultured Desulfovibrio sp.]VZH33555.1 PfkB domain protein [Desulfovibrio sp. 86]
MAIYVSGSLAFDRIMTFPGNFQDHILMDKLHMINVSFMVDGMDERRGGCAGNIAYTLALLGEKPVIVAAAGRDFDSYALTLTAHGLPLDGIRRAEDVFTALCYITTDMNSNQITGFYPGAMTLPAEYDFPGLDARQDLAIVSPGNVEDMRRLPRLYREKGVPYIFDPGQQLPVLTSQELLEAIEGSLACITNDYELNMICKATGKSEAEIAARTQWLVTTLGSEGAQVRGKGENIRIAPVPISKVLDPTGAGDAHRAGLIKGLVHGLAMPEAARLGSVSASFALEKLGTQEHTLTPADFCQRYEAVFGPMPKGIFAA